MGGKERTFVACLSWFDFLYCRLFSYPLSRRSFCVYIYWGFLVLGVDFLRLRSSRFSPFLFGLISVALSSSPPVFPSPPLDFPSLSPSFSHSSSHSKPVPARSNDIKTLTLPP
ncbi:hypothetical protein K435DRAFT_434451 [Dendrothele bispora CBS 962.96]|uniref:Transmembrane protein n=1 Tax=Dendrothele bispora (strain CBS 962.96) TaxID=1314807 RepID=A0A4S8MFC4_DENBC|nr:hypothetical protein K435DRAFT_434451 [Dendrothele bispora CBS 962.96]